MVRHRFIDSTSTLRKSERERPDESALGSVAEPPAAQSPKALERSDIESLIATQYVGLRLLITRRTGNEEVAADLLNDAICTTWEKWQAGQIEYPEQIAGFIFQVAMNHLRNHRRTIAERVDKRAHHDVLETIESPEAGATEGIENHIAARVKDLIQGMDSVRDRTVLVRFYLDEEDRESICRELHLTGAQFARIVHRARARLRQLVESAGLRRSDLFSLFMML
jgi:RNA polymerase sigma-70 factor (ECF subfamily)